MDELSDTKIRNAKPTDKEYTLADGQGLSVVVRPNGTKLWLYTSREARVEHTCCSTVRQLRGPNQVIDFFEQTASCMCHACAGRGEAYSATVTAYRRQTMKWPSRGSSDHTPMRKPPALSRGRPPHAEYNRENIRDLMSVGGV